MRMAIALLMITPGVLLFSQSIIRVPQDQLTIQAGVNAAVDGDTVLVAEGTYIENVRIRKKIVVASLYVQDGDTSHISKTIIDGSSPAFPDTGSVVLFDIGADTSTHLTGFTISGGTGTKLVNTSFIEWRVGGGILVIDGGATVTHNRIIQNSVSHINGGGSAFGVWTWVGPYVVVESNYIASNQINLNTHRYGGGAVNVVCGGYIANNIVAHNTATSGPGQAVNLIGPITMVNNTVALNRATYGATGLAIQNVNARVANNIFWNPGTGAEMVFLRRGIIMDVKNNLIRGDYYGENNLDADPEFSDTLSFALSPGSPCISAGADTAVIRSLAVVAPSLDFYGQSRPMTAGSKPDLGAVESSVQTPTPVTQESRISLHMLGTRPYLVSLPPNYDILSSTKLLIYLHGCTGNGQEGDLFRFRDYADSLGFVSVFPSSVLECWNDGINNLSTSDIVFIDQLIDTLLANYKIDSTKIFFTGYSSGGFLIFRLAVESRHLIAGIAPFAASIGEYVTTNPPQRPVPMIYFHGTGDPTVPWSGTGNYKSIPNVLLRWMGYNSCDTTGVYDFPDVVPDDQATVQKIVFEGNPGIIHSASIHFYKVNGGGHSLPGPYLGGNNPSRDVNGPYEIMHFFDNIDIHTNAERTTSALPAQFELLQNYPNPFNPATVISYQLSAVSDVSLKVYDVLGREVATLVNERLKPGSYSVTWDAAGYPSGVYFYCLNAGEFSETRKLVLLR